MHHAFLGEPKLHEPHPTVCIKKSAHDSELIVSNFSYEPLMLVALG